MTFYGLLNSPTDAVEYPSDWYNYFTNGYSNTNEIVSLGVTFGNPGDSGGSLRSRPGGHGGDLCSGEGICMGVASFNQLPSGIKVDFQLLKEDPSILIMSFNVQELMRKQPQHLPSFRAPSRLYQFDAVYSLATPLFERLCLPRNSRIEPKDPCMLQPEQNGRVIVYIKYSHD